MKTKIILLCLLLTGCANAVVFENATIELYPCPPHNCSIILEQAISLSASASCAFYDLDDYSIINALAAIDSFVILDEDAPDIALDSVRERGSGLMHNKFCVLDGKRVVTGTYNPTVSANNNWNLLLMTNSTLLANLFMDEFEELKRGEFHRGDKNKQGLVKLANANVLTLFCPEDACESNLVSLLSNAEREILFMSFSITSEAVVDALIDAKSRGVIVKGLIEPFQAGIRFAIPKLIQNNISPKKVQVKGLFHHKAFIVDRKIIATGSYNPTRSANERNDEALLFIESPALAQQLADFWFSVPT